jgi:hypothetical protein
MLGTIEGLFVFVTILEEMVIRRGLDGWRGGEAARGV